jgi:hypothetical protein
MRLSDPKNTAPIPYRDSKLTRLLKPVLTGSSKVIVICNISASSESFEESLSTLKFAERAKKIKKTIARNEDLSSNALIEKYESLIRELQTRLSQKESEIAGSVSSETDRKLVEELNKLGSQLSMKEDENQVLDAKLEALYEEKLSMQAELEHIKSLIINSGTVKLNREQPTDVARELTDAKVQQRQSTRIRKSRLSPRMVPIGQAGEELVEESSEDFAIDLHNPFSDAEELVRQESEELRETEALKLQLSLRDSMIIELRRELDRRQEEIGVLHDELELVKTSRTKLLQQVKKLKER